MSGKQCDTSTKMPAPNERFAARGAVVRRKRLCEKESLCAAELLLSAPPSASRRLVVGNAGSAVRLGSEKDRALLTIMAKPEKMND